MSVWDNDFWDNSWPKYPIYRGTFAEICEPLRQMGYVPRPCPNMARNHGIFNFSPKVVTIEISWLVS